MSQAVTVSIWDIDIVKNLLRREQFGFTLQPSKSRASDQRLCGSSRNSSFSFFRGFDMKKSLTVMAFSTTLALAGLSTGAQAVVIVDFNGSSAFLTPGQSAAVDDGYTVNLLTPASSNSFIVITAQANLSNNGTPAVFLANNGNWELTETAPSLLGFDALSLDFRGSFDNAPSRYASKITFLGTKVGGGTVSVDSGPLTNLFANFLLPGTFTGLSALRFMPTVNASGNANDFEFVIDNIAVQAAGPSVPEPASWALMIAGFGLTGAAMRRKTKVRITYA
jgi:PEP-CTERM motif